MLERGDAGLLIGDSALSANYDSSVRKIDLGEECNQMTGLLFVWSFRAGHASAVRATQPYAFQAVCDAEAARGPQGTDAARHVLVGAARFLAAHYATPRAVNQTFNIAVRLQRGDETSQRSSGLRGSCRLVILATLFPLLQSVPYVVCAVSQDQKIVFWNLAAERILVY